MATPSVDVTSYNRFLVSAGIALIGLALVPVWLLMTFPLDELSREPAVEQLTPRSESLASHRERLLATGYDWLWLISGVPALAGSGLIGWGAVRLHKRQKVHDRAEDLDVEEREHRLRELTKVERLERQDAEVREALEEELEASEHATDAPPEARELSRRVEDRRRTLGESYARAETVALGRLVEAFGEERVRSQVGFGTGRSVDALVRAGQHRLVFEFKYLTTPSSSRSPEHTRRLSEFLADYGPGARGVLTYILTPGLAQSEQRASLEARLRDRAARVGDERISVVVVGLNELESMSVEEFRQLFADLW